MIETNKEPSDIEYISGAKAMTMLGLSRHSFEKLVSESAIKQFIINGKTFYDNNEVQVFKQTDIYEKVAKGIIDQRNKLNDLTGKEWLPETKSYFYQKGLGSDSPNAQIEKQHPAPYSFQDIEHLVSFFTKKDMNVLDPFGGIGSTAKACELLGRHCISIELSEKYHNLSILRLEKEVGPGKSENHKFINNDSRIELPHFASNSIDFVVTSPPYWGILNKQDQKVKKGRVSNNLDTKYSEDEADLGNISDYKEFLETLCNKIILQCARVLRYDKYMALIVSDFRDKNRFISFHSDLISKLNEMTVPDGGKLYLQGTKILIQNHKSLLPYGYPFSYVENIHHQYILIFRKMK